MLEIISVTHERGKWAVIYGSIKRQCQDQVILVGDVKNPGLTTTALCPSRLDETLDNKKWKTPREFFIMHDVAHNGVAHNLFADVETLLAAARELFDMRDSTIEQATTGNLALQMA